MNIVFTLDDTYDQVLFDIQDRLFPYPTWKRAEYELATSDGAMIIVGTPFANFPFILAKGGKKALWLVRIEDEETEAVAPVFNDSGVDCISSTRKMRPDEHCHLFIILPRVPALMIMCAMVAVSPVHLDFCRTNNFVLMTYTTMQRATAAPDATLSPFSDSMMSQ